MPGYSVTLTNNGIREFRKLLLVEHEDLCSLGYRLLRSHSSQEHILSRGVVLHKQNLKVHLYDAKYYSSYYVYRGLDADRAHLTLDDDTPVTDKFYWTIRAYTAQIKYLHDPPKGAVIYEYVRKLGFRDTAIKPVTGVADFAFIAVFTSFYVYLYKAELVLWGGSQQPHTVDRLHRVCWET